MIAKFKIVKAKIAKAMGLTAFVYTPNRITQYVDRRALIQQRPDVRSMRSFVSQ